MADLGIGAAGFALESVHSSVLVLQFVAGVVVDARRFGNDVATVRTRLACETARLEYLERYLKEKTDGATPRFEKLPELVRSAILGLIQELDIQFAAYSSFVAKHKGEDFQTGYVRSFEHGIDDYLARKRRDEVEKANDKVSIAGRLMWGLFEKKRVIMLLDNIEGWNSRLMSLLLCGFCFGADEVDAPPRRDWTNEPGLRLEPFSPGASVGTLVRSPIAGSNTVFETERTRVYFEVKAFTLRRRALEPPPIVLRRICRLADLLAHDASGPDIGFRTLKCIGVVRLPAPTTGFAFAFDLPEAEFGLGTNNNAVPYTLLNALEERRVGHEGPRRPSLGERFAMARALALTVFQLHSVDWLHKSIRSENVLIPRQQSQQDPEPATESTVIRWPGVSTVAQAENPKYARPVLVGFEFSREEGDVSTPEQDARPDRNIYRHPDRQGQPDTRFAARHDVYALGVIFLEIGLWQPAIRLDARFTADGGGNALDPEATMRALCDHARIRLPHYMGVDYAEAVLACLQGPALSVHDGRDVATEELRTQNNMTFFNLVVEKIARGIVPA
ncbi:hypothetical protein GQ53DRAFT_885425 [Thozetella sp. PMI_491]|nr:hypothetical protein GQ53DRAFT_885425 [Thozetella sp. PMI_491]